MHLATDSRGERGGSCPFVSLERALDLRESSEHRDGSSGVD